MSDTIVVSNINITKNGYQHTSTIVSSMPGTQDVSFCMYVLPVVVVIEVYVSKYHFIMVRPLSDLRVLVSVIPISGSFEFSIDIHPVQITVTNRIHQPKLLIHYS